MLPPKLLGVHLDVIHFFAFVAFSISSFVFMHVTFIDIVTFFCKISLFGSFVQVLYLNFIHST